MDAEQDMTGHVEAMNKACKHHGLDQRANDSIHTPNAWEYLINEEHALVWCNVFKSGSTR